MPSTLSWLDYSDHERRKALEVIDLFHEKETRDELGIGSIRDAFADLLFPGTSTIQTRAKYFFFIPWIFSELEQHRLEYGEARLNGRRGEVALMNELAKAEDDQGVIGKQSRDTLKRLPSSVYWAGLASWGIRQFQGSVEEYYRSLEDSSVRQPYKKQLKAEDLDYHASHTNWHTNLPPAPKEFPKSATFELSKAEADYLVDRVRSRSGESMLAVVLHRGIQTQCEYAWEYPLLGQLPVAIQEQLEHAAHFSSVLHGAALYYNLLLAKKIEWKKKIELYESSLEEWWNSIMASKSQLDQWDRNRFWEIAKEGNSRLPVTSIQFVDRWLDIVLAAKSLSAVSNSRSSEQLIYEREFRLKRNRARLRNPRALENWGGSAGTARIDCRWKAAQIIINDILSVNQE